jgi:membrane protease YdiL (CAAX protease family)
MNTPAKRAAIFVAVTFFISWLMVAVFLLCGGVLAPNSPATLILSIAYMFVPMTVAVCLRKFAFRESVWRPLGVSFRPNYWFVIAWLLPVGIAFGALAIGLLFPGTSYAASPDAILERFRGLVTPEKFEQMRAQMATMPHPLLLAVCSALVAGPTINAIAAFGEEVGWRGFLFRELGHMGFWKSSLLIGAIWGIWHAPLIMQGHNYPQHPMLGVGMMVVVCMLLAPIFAYVRLRAKSVIAAAIIHGSFNATAGIAAIMTVGGNDLTIGVTGLAGLVTLAIVNVGIWIHDTRIAGRRASALMAGSGLEIEHAAH